MDERRLREMADEEIDLMVMKNEDYSGQSGDNISATGMNGVAVRLMDKVARLLNLTEGNTISNFESVEDTLKDISNYAKIGRLLKEGKWQNKPRMVYLAGPMDCVSVNEAIEWRVILSEVLNDGGISTFSPTAFRTAKGGEKVTRAINDMAIFHSDLVIANLLSSRPSFGTIREIEYAVQMEKPVIVIWPREENIPLYAYDVTVVYDMDGALRKVMGK